MSATVQGEKKSLFGYFKNIFWKSDPAVASADDEVRVIGATPVAPVEPEVPVARIVNPAPSVVEADSVAADDVNNAAATGVTLPLQSVLASLPVELRNQIRIAQVGDLAMTIPFERILSQLSSGVVKISFGDIRSAAPHAFARGIEGDMVQVTLPLNDILSRINPALLMRRRTQRIVADIPDEIISPFEGKNLSSLSVGNAKPVTPAAPRKAAPSPTSSGRGFSPAVTPAEMLRAAAVAPVKPVAGARVSSPRPAPFASQDEIDSIPSPFINNSIAPASAPTLSPSISTPITTPKAAPQAVASKVAQALFMPVALKALTENWPEPLRQEIIQQNLVEAKLALPTEPVEIALKRGRVAFPWKLIRSWIRPATAPMVSVHDAVEVELPLRVLAPLFVARQRAGKFGQHSAPSAEEIPDVFLGAPAQASAAVSTPTHPPVSAAPSVVTPAIPIGLPIATSRPTSVSTPRVTDTNYFEKPVNLDSDTTRLHVAELSRTGASGTEFVTRYATPNEIVSRAAALEGVAGALIALPDGLMVASRIPSDLNSDTLAAFLPQLFSKMTACTKELRMGELNNLNFTVGNVPWKIFRVNAIFFAAFGCPNHSMPSAQLAALAAELDRKNK